MPKHGKNYRKSAEAIERRPYPLAEAVQVAKGGGFAKFAMERERTLEEFAEQRNMYTAAMADDALMGLARYYATQSMSDEEILQDLRKTIYTAVLTHEVGHALGFSHNWKASLAASWEDVAAGRVRAVDVVERSLQRCERVQGVLNAFTEIDRDGAVARAAAIDRTVAGGGDPGPLAGVPFRVKDIFCVQGTPTTAASPGNTGWMRNSA